MTVSIEVAGTDDAYLGSSPEELIHAADSALYPTGVLASSPYPIRADLIDQFPTPFKVGDVRQGDLCNGGEPLSREKPLVGQ